MSDYVPTIDDLRVKLCYICREEEHHGQIPYPPPAWTHPCQCTLLAHESCLLQWIQTAQLTSPAAAQNALKCPQCGSQYELESKNPAILKLLTIGNAMLQKAGKVFTIFGIGVAGSTVASVIWWILTRYGAYAVREFLGREMYDTLLTDDPSNWPMLAFINLPIVPLTLIASRFIVPPILPMAHFVLDLQPSRVSLIQMPTTQPTETFWPPSPFLFSFFVFPITQMVYGHFYRRFSRWLLGNGKPLARNEEDDRMFVIRIRAIAGDDAPLAPEANANARRANVNGAAAAEPQVPGAFAEEHAAENAPAPAGPVDAAVVPAAEQPIGNPEQVIQVHASSIGRQVGGALLIPLISNRMGALLFQISKRWAFLRKFLAVRPKWSGTPLAPRFVPLDPKDGFFTWKVILRVFAGSSWKELDPVWWRNSIGFGLFVVAKDCLHLLHLWLAKRELTSRKVKNRDFSGVDVGTLDLIPNWPLSFR